MSTTFVRRANRYLSDSLETAAPATLLVLLYDRLVLDLQRAEAAQADGDRETAHQNLTHAQDIVHELMAGLDVGAWHGGPGLLSLYTWIVQELITANVAGDVTRTRTCRTEVVEPLAQAWREAAVQHLGGSSHLDGGSA